MLGLTRKKELISEYLIANYSQYHKEEQGAKGGRQEHLPQTRQFEVTPLRRYVLAADLRGRRSRFWKRLHTSCSEFGTGEKNERSQEDWSAGREGGGM